MFKHSGASIIFVNDHKQVLLLLRDDKPGLPYRNMWDVPGGHIELGETPKQCIMREMKEETAATELAYGFNEILEEFHQTILN